MVCVWFPSSPPSLLPSLTARCPSPAPVEPVTASQWCACVLTVHQERPVPCACSKQMLVIPPPQVNRWSECVRSQANCPSPSRGCYFFNLSLTQVHKQTPRWKMAEKLGSLSEEPEAQEPAGGSVRVHGGHLRPGLQGGARTLDSNE